MSDDSSSANLLDQEKWSIELLARETKTPLVTVQQMFIAEYAKLSLNAHIKSFLSLLTTNQVRCLLDAQNLLDAQKAEKTAKTA
jgi:hypothetical protein